MLAKQNQTAHCKEPLDNVSSKLCLFSHCQNVLKAMLAFLPSSRVQQGVFLPPGQKYPVTSNVNYPKLLCNAKGIKSIGNSQAAVTNEE